MKYIEKGGKVRFSVWKVLCLFETLILVVCFWVFYKEYRYLHDGAIIHLYKKLPEHIEYPYHTIQITFNDSGAVGHVNIIETEVKIKGGVIERRAFGQSPISKIELLPNFTSDVKGGVREETVKPPYEYYNTSFLVMPLTSKQYNKYCKVKNKWGNKLYNITDQNCITFANEVADAIGLQTPKDPKIYVPKVYLNDLCKLNKDDFSYYHEGLSPFETTIKTFVNFLLNL